MWFYFLLCRQLGAGLIPIWMYVWVCEWLQVRNVRRGKVLSSNSYFIGLDLLLCVRDMQGERFISLKVQKVRFSLRVSPHSQPSLYWLKEKTLNNQAPSLVLARRNCSRQLHFLLLFLSSGVLLRPLIKCPTLPDSHWVYDELGDKIHLSISFL